ncbi:Two pore calcium channel protein 1-like 2 [Homarus americanus]|uniref:Two pore calcium channel protein 1-like 2 n=1 Tax=Homarus americanus TaxID=6706 RepID=A0A8J5MSC9_HOMAM|nr:Two pore calcium channel protein 1-like 2 [Homarus americanus]
MESINDNNNITEVIIENESNADQLASNNVEASASKVHHRRTSSLQLRKNKVDHDSTPISVIYKPEAETIEVSNIADGSTAIDSTDVPPVSDLNLLLAATYVEDARDGRHSDFKVSERHLKLYHMYQSKWGQIVLYCILFLHLSLALFEKPAVHGLSLKYWITITMEIGIMFFYLFRLIHISVFTPLTRFWSDTKNILIIVFVGLTFLDMVIYIGLVETGHYGIRWSRVLRPLFVVNFPEMRQIRRSFRNLRRTLPDVVNVLFLFFFSLAIFALMAFKLFGDRGLKWVNGRPYFQTYWDSIFDLYVLVTTANNPDIMMPAFDDSIAYVIFFVAFLIICYFIFMNIILAVIYNNYRKHLKNEVKKTVYSKRQQLSKAFEILAVNLGGQRIITRSRFVQFMRFLDSQKNPALINVFWIVLDTDGSHSLEKWEFLKLADLLNVEVSEVVDRRTFIGHYFPSVYYSRPSKFLCRVVRHKLFRVFFDILTLINAVVIGIATPYSTWDDSAEWFFLSFFMMEILLKLYVMGVRRYFKHMWNVFDIVVIGSAFVLGIVEAIIETERKSRLSLDVLLVLRVLRLVKIIGNVSRFKVIVHTISKIVPSLLTYGGVIMVFYYMFAMVGMESFQGLVKFTGYDIDGGSDLFCSNKKLEDSDFWNEHYCNNNFNDCLLIAYGYAAVTNPWARLYFLFFHLICVIIVLNIFTAFVLEVFILEYSASCQGNLESQMEKKIQEMGLSLRRKSQKAATVSEEDLVVSDSDSFDSEDEREGPFNEGESTVDGRITPGASSFYTGYKDISSETDVRFHISKRLKNVEVLLQKMFEKELDVDDLGPHISTLDQDLQDDEYVANQDQSLWGM